MVPSTGAIRHGEQAQVEGLHESSRQASFNGKVGPYERQQNAQLGCLRRRVGVLGLEQGQSAQDDPAREPGSNRLHGRGSSSSSRLAVEASSPKVGNLRATDGRDNGVLCVAARCSDAVCCHLTA